MQEIDFSGYMLDRVQVDEYAFNWKTFIEVYLEDYHVVPFHPGLGNFVDCDDLKWEFGEQYSVQTVGIRNGLRKTGSDVYDKWQEQVLRYHGGKLPKYGAIWLTYYPNIMVEWYPGTLVVSTLVPRGPEACTNIVEFYYLEDIVLFEREYVEAEQKAYNETAVEDDIICLQHAPGTQVAVPARHRRTRPVPVAHRRRHAAFPRIPAPQSCITPLIVIPVQTGHLSGSIQSCIWACPRHARNYFIDWIPACAGMTKNTGSLWMLVAGLLFGCMGVFVKLGAPYFSHIELVFYRSFVGLLLVYLIMRSAARQRCHAITGATTCGAASPARSRSRCSSTASPCCRSPPPSRSTTPRRCSSLSSPCWCSRIDSICR